MRVIKTIFAILFPFILSASDPVPVVISSSPETFWASGECLEIFFNYDKKILEINELRTTGMCIWIVNEVHIFPDSGSISQVIVNFDDSTARLIRK